jgi:hypothetical protein
MTDYNIPPDNKEPMVLHAGDTLRVEDHGTSHDITLLDGATEGVFKGGASVRTTVNEGGTEDVEGGTANFTTINGGQLGVFQHGTADHTRLNSIGSDLQLHDGSIAKDTIIQNGIIFADATSTVENVTFERATGKFATEGVEVENPQNLKGTLSGLAVGDFLRFGALKEGPSIDVTSFEVKNDALTITYNNGQHATYQLSNMQAGDTFKLTHEKGIGGGTYSVLTVIKAPAHEDVAHHHREPELTLPLVGVDAHHNDFGHHLFG